jgi:hypothetical protein
MALVKSHGQMYPWVTHMHTHLRGECPHKCSYCYVKSFPGTAYKGPLRIDEKQLDVKYTDTQKLFPKNKIIFIEHCQDLFALDVKEDWIEAILIHCNQYPNNTYVFQTKNPLNMLSWIRLFPQNFMMGVTIETNRAPQDLTTAPSPAERLSDLLTVRGLRLGHESGPPLWEATFKARLFITIEPILEMDPLEFATKIALIGPAFVNIGADSKNHGLAEPNNCDIILLVAYLKEKGVEIREKHNLGRLLEKK